jgi:ubiquinone/menaquinone biosynthesis C-methylase UbiE
MTKYDRLQREKLFHDNRFGGDDADRAVVSKYYLSNKHSIEKYVEIISKLCVGKDLLEYGCGMGDNTNQWLKHGARVTGIDISEEGINVAKNNMKNSGHHANYYVMNAEMTAFGDNSFDLVVGTGILHHLDLIQSYKELSRICKVDAHIVFSEPLGHNPIINLYRLLTPKIRTDDEQPMKANDIELLNHYFNSVKCEYFSLFTLISVLFIKFPFFNFINNIFRVVDKILFSIPYVKRYAWVVVIHASNPKK